VKIDTIAVASVQDPREMRSFSGIPAHICLAFEDAGVQIVPGGPLEVKEPPFYRWFRSAFCRLGLKWPFVEVEPYVLRHQASILQSIVRGSKAQAVVSILPEPMAAKPLGMRTALVHDATYALLFDYYGMYTGWSKRSIRLAHKAYRKAVEHASVLIYSSQWAAQSAIHDYGADAKKVHVVEFGANLRNPPSREQVAEMVEQRLSTGEHRFLFLGVDWERKGGDDAIALVRKLRDAGVSAVLDVVGCTPQGHADSQEFCIEHGFLDKRKSRDQEKLKNLLERACFLLVPTLADCTPCVYAEANAYGIPSIGRDTGGVSQMIRPGINGFLVSQNGDNLDTLVDQIKRNLLDPNEYRKLCQTSRNEYEERLNWARFVEKTLRLLEDAEV
jgi:glycosyltransferase involved in cell wall biosynthesis